MIKYKLLRRLALVLRDLQVLMLRANAAPHYIAAVSDMAWRAGCAAKEAAESYMIRKEDRFYNKVSKAVSNLDELDYAYEAMKDEHDEKLSIIEREVL